MNIRMLADVVITSIKSENKSIDIEFESGNKVTINIDYLENTIVFKSNYNGIDFEFNIYPNFVSVFNSLLEIDKMLSYKKTYSNNIEKIKVIDDEIELDGINLTINQKSLLNINTHPLLVKYPEYYEIFSQGLNDTMSDNFHLKAIEFLKNNSIELLNISDSGDGAQSLKGKNNEIWCNEYNETFYMYVIFGRLQIEVLVKDENVKFEEAFNFLDSLKSNELEPYMEITMLRYYNTVTINLTSMNMFDLVYSNDKIIKTIDYKEKEQTSQEFIKENVIFNELYKYVLGTRTGVVSSSGDITLKWLLANNSNFIKIDNGVLVKINDYEVEFYDNKIITIYNNGKFKYSKSYIRNAEIVDTIIGFSNEVDNNKGEFKRYAKKSNSKNINAEIENGKFKINGNELTKFKFKRSLGLFY